jgi:hypothetical protein
MLLAAVTVITKPVVLWDVTPCRLLKLTECLEKRVASIITVEFIPRR